MQFPTEQFINFAKQYKVPDYVKSAYTKDFEEVTNPRTKVGCYFAKFAALVGQEVPVSERDLEKRAQILNMQDDLSELEAQFADHKEKSIVKTAAPTEKYPVRNKNEFIAAQNWLKKNAYAIPITERRALAEKLLEKSAQFEAEVDEQLYKFAGQYTGDRDQLTQNFIKRAELIRISRVNTPQQRRKTAEDLEAVAEVVRLQPNATTEPENLDKIAATLQFLDNEYGLHAHYRDGYIDTPDNTCFVHNPKIAEDIKIYAYTIGDEVYDIRDFENIKVADIIDTFGEDFATAMTDGLSVSHEKVAYALSVMTDVEHAVFVDLIKSAGVKPQYFRRERVNLKELAKILA